MMDLRATLVSKRHVAGIAVAAALTLDRCRYGVDVADEAQYISQAFVPLIGGRPFFSDTLLQQAVSLLLTPWLWLYRFLSGDIQGIVLITRVVWCVTALIAAVVLATRFLPHIGRWAASACASLIVVFIPFAIPSISYNTLGLLFLTLGLCDTRPLNSGQVMFLSAAAFCYPPLAIALIGVLVHGISASESRSRALVLSIWCTLTGLGIISACIVAFGWSAMVDAYNVTSSLGVFGTIAKLQLWNRQVIELLAGHTILTTILAIGLFLLAVRQDVALAVLGLTGLLIFSRPDIPYFWHYLVPFFALAAAPLTLRRHSIVPRHCAAISLLCGLVTAWASSNGLPNSAIGCFPAFLLGLAEWCRVAPPTGARLLRPTFFMCGVAGIGLWFSLATRAAIYFDQPIDQLTAVVEVGPYRGIRTTPERRDFIQNLQRDVRVATNDSGTILFMYGFPAGYLLSSTPPASRLLFLYPWNLPSRVREIVVPKGTAELPSWIVHIKSVPGKAFTGPGDDDLNELLLRSNLYRPVIDRTGYEILQRRA